MAEIMHINLLIAEDDPYVVYLENPELRKVMKKYGPYEPEWDSRIKYIKS